MKKIFRTQHPALNEFRKTIKYLIVGGSGAVADLALSTFLIEIIKIWYLVATAFSFITVTWLVFWGQRIWTFRSRNQQVKRQMSLFFITTVLSLGINQLIIFLSVSQLSWHYFWAIFLAKWVVLIWNFSLNRFLVFK